MVQNVLSTKDFDNVLDNYAGRQVLHTPVVKTISNISGQETLTDGTPVSIKAYFVRTMQSFDYQKAGFIEIGDAILLSKYADGVQVNDKITAEGNTFRVKQAYNVAGEYDSTGNATSFTYTVCNLFLIQ